MQNNYLDMLGKLKFDSGVGEKQKVSSGDPNIVVTYTTRFADKNPEYSIKLRFMFDMQRGDPNPVIRNWHQFKSEKDGNFMSIDCPAARCPICNGTFTVWSSGDAFAREKLKKSRFMRQQTWYLNAYVVDNPVNPEQNGSVKIIKMNKPIMEAFKRATSGRDAKRFGMNVFRLDAEGNTFVINIKDVRGEGNQRYPQFDCYFLDAEDSAEDVAGLNDEKIEELYKKTFDLSTYFKKPSVEEVQKVFDEHVRIAFPDILGGVAPRPAAVVQEKPSPAPVAKSVPMPTKPLVSTVGDDDDDLPGFDQHSGVATVEHDSTTEIIATQHDNTPKPTKDKATSDEKVNELLAEYGISDL